MNNGVTAFLLIIQFLITLMFYPLKVGANGHVSLAHDKIELDVRLFRLTVVRLRIKREKGVFKLLLNGKRIKGEKNKKSGSRFANVIERYRIEGLKLKGNLLALIGAQDAKITSMLCAAIGGVLSPVLDGLQIYTATPSDTLEIDGRVKLKINILQILGLVSAGLRG